MVSPLPGLFSPFSVPGVRFAHPRLLVLRPSGAQNQVLKRSGQLARSPCISGAQNQVLKHPWQLARSLCITGAQNQVLKHPWQLARTVGNIKT